jgi:WD40 repeat protein
MWGSRKLACWAAVAAVAALVVPGTALAAQPSPPIGAYTTAGAWSFVSAPNLHPPRLHTDTSTRSRKLAKGLFLTANFPNITTGKPLTGQGGPLILNNRLQPVWFDPTPTNVVTLDLKQQTFEGKPALSWWEGVLTSTGAATSGEVFVVNQHYRQVATLTGDTADGWVISPHEVVIRGHDAWVTSYKVVPNVDLSPYGGKKNGTLYDSAVQEYDLRTGKLLSNWDAFNPGGTPKVPLSESEGQAPPNPNVPWDAYHVNSIQLVGSHEFLVSFRNTWAAYLVDMNTGNVIWTLGGKASSFAVPAAAQFQFQHHVQLLSGNEVSLYDDHCCAFGKNGFVPPAAGSQSRGLLLKLNFSNHTASLVQQYVRTPSLISAFTGSTQLLPNGNVLVGWGSQPFFTEFSPSGKMLLDAVWPGVDLSYRVLFTPNWVGKPFYGPSGAVLKHHGRSVVYASWDGATEVVKWEVLAGHDRKHLKLVASKAKGGFETAIHLRRAYREYRVRAVDSHGRSLATSGLFPKPSGAGFNPGSY